MGIVAVYVLYLLMSLLLAVVSAVTLAASGNKLLTHAFAGDQAVGRAVSRLFVVGSALLNAGFVILAMRTSASVHDTRQAVELLAVKLGEAMLIIGSLHLLTVVILIRAGRRPGSSGPVWVRHTDDSAAGGSSRTLQASRR